MTIGNRIMETMMTRTAATKEKEVTAFEALSTDQKLCEIMDFLIDLREEVNILQDQILGLSPSDVVDDIEWDDE